MCSKSRFCSSFTFLFYFWPIQWLFKSCYKILLITCQAKKKKCNDAKLFRGGKLEKEKPIGLYFFPFLYL